MSKKISLTIVMFLLLFSWIALYQWGNISIGAYAPYENTPPTRRPPLGTWQRHLNDFFCRKPMNHSLSYVLIAIALGFTIYAIWKLYRHKDILWTTLLKLSLGNLALVVLSAVAVLYLPTSVEIRLLKPQGQYRPGYEFTYEYIVLDIVMCSLWVYYNFKVVRRSLRTENNAINASLTEPEKRRQG